MTRLIKGWLPQSEIGKQKLSSFKTRKLEKALGLERGSLKDGFRITEIQNIQNLNPRIPTSGNKYFRPGEGLPGGGPELVVDPISTGRK